MLHGGQVSFFLQLVKIPLLINVLFYYRLRMHPYNLGSFSYLSKIFLCNLIFVSLAVKDFIFKVKITFEK